MKKCLCVTLSVLIMALSLFTSFAEDEPIGYEDFTQGTVDSYGNYLPLVMCYAASLIMADGSQFTDDVGDVIITVVDNVYTVTPNEVGEFFLEFPDARDNAVITLSNPDYFISSNYPEGNNLLFPAFSRTPSKSIVVSKRSKIAGRVTDITETKIMSDVTVTCYKLNSETKEWELWIEKGINESANQKTDSNGNFSFDAISGEYKLTCNVTGYSPYSSMDYEYVSGGHSTIKPGDSNTGDVVIHMSVSKVLKLNSAQIINIEKTEPIILEFDRKITSSTAASLDSIKLVKVGSTGYTPCNVTVSDSTVTIKPTSALNNTKYTLYVTKNLKGTDGSSLLEDRIITVSVVSKDETSSDSDNDPSPDDDLKIPVVFTDIQNHWAYNYIVDLIQAEVISQNSAYYYPEVKLTREEFAKYIVLALGYKIDKYESGLFADEVLINSNYLDYIMTAYNNKLILGNEEEEGLCYLPKSPITRAEIITIIGRFLGESDASAEFVDMAEVPDWAVPYVSACIESGLIQGSQESDGLYLFPMNNITRAETSAIISRLKNSSDAKTDEQ